MTRVRQYSESEFDTPALQRAWELTDFRGIVYVPVLTRHREELPTARSTSPSSRRHR